MGLINYTNIEDNTPALANGLNERFGAIVDEVNGNLSSQNLANSAVTREKIAPGAVSSDKLDLSYTTDANGWQVFDFGPFKRYVRSVVTLPGSSRNFDAIPYPVGVVRANVKEVSVALTATADDGTGDWGRVWVSARLNASDIQGFQKQFDPANVFPTGLLQLVLVA